MFRTLILALSLFFAAKAAAHSWSVEEFIVHVLDEHPELLEVNARDQYLEQQYEIASAWPDAHLGAEYSNMPLLNPRPGSHPMSGIQLTVSQRIPFFNKIEARKDAARVARFQSLPETQEVRNRVTGTVWQGAQRLQRYQALTEVTQRHIDSANELLGAIQSRYELGRTEQHELIRVEVLRDTLIDELQDLKRRRDAESRALAALIPRKKNPEFKISHVDFGRLPKAFEKSISLQALLDEAIQNRPLYAVFLSQAQSQVAMAKALRQEVWPDIKTWVGYRVRLPSDNDAGNDFFSLGISVPIGWSSGSRRWEASALQKEAQANALVAQYKGLTLHLKQQLSVLLVERTRSQERAHFYRDTILPRAEKNLSSVLSSYQVNRAGFAELFSAQIARFDFEKVAINARANVARIDIAINTLVGRYASSKKSTS